MEAQLHLPLTRVFLWTAPRCLSTVSERSVRELDGVKVLHEPYNSAYREIPPIFYECG